MPKVKNRPKGKNLVTLVAGDETFFQRFLDSKKCLQPNSNKWTRITVFVLPPKALLLFSLKIASTAESADKNKEPWTAIVVPPDFQALCAIYGSSY
jgi:hypothetical protein